MSVTGTFVIKNPYERENIEGKIQKQKKIMKIQVANYERFSAKNKWKSLMEKQVAKLKNCKNVMEKYGGKIEKIEKFMGKQVAKVANYRNLMENMVAKLNNLKNVMEKRWLNLKI